MRADFGNVTLLMVCSNDTACMAAFFQDAKTVVGLVQPQFMGDGEA
jgi:hypothetical protein